MTEAIMKVFVYKMDAGMYGTEETFTIVGTEGLTSKELWEYIYDHAISYQGEDEEWESGEPEGWLETMVTTLAQLEECSGYLLYGNDTLEGLVEELELEGMKFNDKEYSSGT